MGGPGADRRSRASARPGTPGSDLGPIAFEYSSFAVDGRPDLGMVVYNPATSADADLIRAHLQSLDVSAKVA